jgi:dihydrolipoamide dehydrogenase
LKSYDVIVIGSGCGMNIVEEALAFGSTVALIDKGPMGGTCPNNGCIPSKMMIFPADRLAEIEEAKKVGADVEVRNADFKAIMERVRHFVKTNQEEMRHGVDHARDLGFYEGEGHFIDDHTLEVNGQQVRGQKIFIASGSRPSVPSIRGLDTVDYLTNESLIFLEERPESIIIIGGGYVAAEYGHFFSRMGTRVTILEMADRMVLSEDIEIAQALQKELGKRVDIQTGIRVEEVIKDNGSVSVRVSGGKAGTKKYSAARLLVATGRTSNADLLKATNAGIELDSKGYIKTNEFLETNQKHIYAVGDANGQQMFTHVANRESTLAVHNGLHGSRLKMDYDAAPHAVFTYPQIASVGLTEEAARKTHRVFVGRAKYADVAAGDIMRDDTGFAKAIVEAGPRNKILGFHVIGPYASIVVQEVINAMASGGGIEQLQAGMHIHPAMPELVLRALANLEE